ncbi:hypothetical protein Taro_042629 [Colocasia esculenta]|uniref:Uncharacterized protein n=1 Tax=Colocasia esculenta TaxID=4460 RepID=A0A843WHD0_COLES|nr:hypothetical protein [Colocasia esculenta]
MDSLTAHRKRLHFARVCVLVDVEAEFPSKVDILNEDGSFDTILVECEWKHVLCTECNSFGHGMGECRAEIKTQKKVWRVKVQNTSSDELPGALELHGSEKNESSTLLNSKYDDSMQLCRKEGYNGGKSMNNSNAISVQSHCEENVETTIGINAQRKEDIAISHDAGSCIIEESVNVSISPFILSSGITFVGLRKREDLVSEDLLLGMLLHYLCNCGDFFPIRILCGISGLDIHSRPKETVLHEGQRLLRRFRSNDAGRSVACATFGVALWWIWKERAIPEGTTVANGNAIANKDSITYPPLASVNPVSTVTCIDTMNDIRDLASNFISVGATPGSSTISSSDQTSGSTVAGKLAVSLNLDSYHTDQVMKFSKLFTSGSLHSLQGSSEMGNSNSHSPWEVTAPSPCNPLKISAKDPSIQQPSFNSVKPVPTVASSIMEANSSISVKPIDPMVTNGSIPIAKSVAQLPLIAGQQASQGLNQIPSNAATFDTRFDTSKLKDVDRVNKLDRAKSWSRSLPSKQ